MNILKITMYGKGYVLEFKEQRLNILNQKGLVWHLKKHVGLDHTARQCILNVLAVESSVEVNIDWVGGAA